MQAKTRLKIRKRFRGKGDKVANRFSLGKLQKGRYFDPILILIILLITAFGLVMLYSVSSYNANVQFGDSAYYFKKQLTNTLIGFAVMMVVGFIPYRFWQKCQVLIYAVAVILLILIIPYGVRVNGAKRWLRIAGISVQPAEIAKIAVIIVTAYVLVKIGSGVDTFKGFVYSLAAAVPLVLMIYLITGNLSSAIIVAGIAFVMSYAVSRNHRKYLLSLLLVVAAGAAYVFYVIKSDGSLGFRSERILAWLDPNAYASGKGFQTLQALYAIGSGGYMGKGIGESMQKLGYIPEAQNDMIFAIICEELGFLGAVGIILLFLILLWRCLIIALNAPDKFGSLIVVGFMAHIAIQVILNIAVVTNTVPNTGISLPFISYGGSSVVSLMFEVGLIISVQRSIRVKED